MLAHPSPDHLLHSMHLIVQTCIFEDGMKRNFVLHSEFINVIGFYNRN